MNKSVVLIGTQWGDEGKGKIVDLLTRFASGWSDFKGGHNAGHTLVVEGKKDGSSSNSFGHPSRRCPCMIGGGVVLSLPHLFTK